MSTTIEYTAELIEALADSSRDRQEWLARGRELAQADSAGQFEIGDWLIAGEEKWSRKAYAEASAIFNGYAKATLFTFASVARSVETLSRNKDLSWNHHKVVARFGPEKQRELLSRAAQEGLNISAFRKSVNKECPPRDNPEDEPDRPVKLVLTVPANTIERLARVAMERGDEVESTALYLIERALRLPDIWQKAEDLSEDAT